MEKAWLFVSNLFFGSLKIISFLCKRRKAPQIFFSLRFCGGVGVQLNMLGALIPQPTFLTAQQRKLPWLPARSGTTLLTWTSISDSRLAKKIIQYRKGYKQQQQLFNWIEEWSGGGGDAFNRKCINCQGWGKKPGYLKRKPAQWVYCFFGGFFEFFNLNVIRTY